MEVSIPSSITIVFTTTSDVSLVCSHGRLEEENRGGEIHHIYKLLKEP